MITNIIKNIIKDIPSVANSSIRLMNENRDNGQFTYNSVGEPTNIKIKALDKSKTTIF